MMSGKQSVTYVAGKDLTIEGRQIRAGEVVGSIQTEVPLERLAAGVVNGAFVPEAEFRAAEEKAAKDRIDRAQAELNRARESVKPAAVKAG